MKTSRNKATHYFNIVHFCQISKSCRFDVIVEGLAKICGMSFIVVSDIFVTLLQFKRKIDESNEVDISRAKKSMFGYEIVQQSNQFVSISVFAQFENIKIIPITLFEFFSGLFIRV